MPLSIKTLFGDSHMATAKQLLQYVANRGTEQDAARLLNASGIKFKDSANEFTVNEDGQMVNAEGGVVNFGMGQITAFAFDKPAVENEPGSGDQASGGKTADGLNPDGGKGDLSTPPAGIENKTDGPMASTSVPGAPIQGGVHTATQIGSGETLATVPVSPGVRQAVAAVPSGPAAQHAAAAGTPGGITEAVKLPGADGKSKEGVPPGTDVKDVEAIKKAEAAKASAALQGTTTGAIPGGGTVKA